jgi:HAD superfamily phosphoserine phosphatase-like hydrolase
MQSVIQDSFTELVPDPGLDEPLVMHQHNAGVEGKAAVIFVHGLGGSRYGRKATWGKFPGFLFEDLTDVDVGMYRYRTLIQRLRFTRSLELEDEARVFADVLRDLNVYTNIVLVGHSMGGLLCKGAISRLLDSNQLKVLERLRALILMATPQLGSLRVPRFLWRWTADSRALRPHGHFVNQITETFQNRVNGDLAANVRERLLLPTYSVCAASDQWVDRLSAGISVSAAQTKTVIGSHASIVKPPSKNNDAYQFVRDRAKESIQRTGPSVEEVAALCPLPARIGTSKGQYRVIAFDLDGTLIRGLEFSWTRVWQYLQFPDSVRKTGMLRYRRRQTSYQQWCEWACKLFREKQLKRADFPKIIDGLTVTKNLREAIRLLKDDGFVTALISGGIDVFLEELIPNADQLFDYIFINHLKFDSTGVLAGVEATPYDFEGKATALERVCKERGYTLEQAVFVGEGFNDEFVAGRAGLTIAYPPTSQGFRNAAGIEIADDDLMKVVEQVLK